MSAMEENESREEKIVTSVSSSGSTSELGEAEVKLCYCGEKENHPWAPNSQCCPPDTESENQESTGSPSLFSSSPITDIQSQEDVLPTDASNNTVSSWGIDRLPPSLVEEVEEVGNDGSSVECDGMCITAQRLRQDISRLEAENKSLREQLEQAIKVPGYPEYFNITYEDDQSVYVFKLLEDYRAGDLKVLVQ